MMREPATCVCGLHAFVGLTKGFVALFDPNDLPRIAGLRWHASPSGRTVYARNHSKLRTSMHRLLLGTQEGMVTDHINGNGLDNRRCNLRHCFHAENIRNMRPHKRSGTSQFKGVCWHGSDGKWRAQIYLGEGSKRSQRVLGSFKTELEAALAYDVAARTHYGEFARTNFPSDTMKETV